LSASKRRKVFQTEEGEKNTPAGFRRRRTQNGRSDDVHWTGRSLKIDGRGPEVENAANQDLGSGGKEKRNQYETTLRESGPQRTKRR